MKKLLIATAIGAIALTGCASKPTPAKVSTYDMNPHHKGEHGHHHGGRHKHAQHAISDKYKCSHDTSVLATYYPEQGEATINVTIPSLNLNNQDIKMIEAVTGSGTRYVNKIKATTEYSWQVKEGTAFLDITTDGKTTAEIKCEAERPKPKKKKSR